MYTTKQKPEIVVLIQSPKINLKRLISTIKPEQIIADGSNYKSYINKKILDWTPPVKLADGIRQMAQRK